VRFAVLDMCAVQRLRSRTLSLGPLLLLLLRAGIRRCLSKTVSLRSPSSPLEIAAENVP
jgi:hypothetical protein